MSLLLRERLTEEAAAQLREHGLVDLELSCRIVGAGLHLDTITADALDMADSDQFELPLS
jgi:hypothetical protein